MKSLGVASAMLHGGRRDESILASNLRSDLDLVVRQRPDCWMVQLSSELHIRGIGLVLVWHSDVDTWNLYVADRQLCHAVQFDLVHSPKGRVGYGIKSDSILDSAIEEPLFLRATLLDERLYLLRKRFVKGDYKAVRELQDSWLSARREQAHRRVPNLFTRSLRAQIHTLIAGELPRQTGRGWFGIALPGDRHSLPNPRRDFRYLAWTLQRQLGRLVNPSGCWVHLTSPTNSDRVLTDLRERVASDFPMWFSELNQRGSLVRRLSTVVRAQKRKVSSVVSVTCGSYSGSWVDFERYIGEGDRMEDVLTSISGFLSRASLDSSDPSGQRGPI